MFKEYKLQRQNVLVVLTINTVFVYYMALIKDNRRQNSRSKSNLKSSVDDLKKSKLSTYLMCGFEDQVKKFIATLEVY